jgi:PhnB protein
LAEHKAPTGFFVTVGVPDPVRAAEIFRALSSGGEVGMPFQQTFWSAGFGVLVDRFGIPWEVNCEQAPASARP